MGLGWCLYICHRGGLGFTGLIVNSLSRLTAVLALGTAKRNTELRMVRSVMEKSDYVFKLLTFKKSIRQSKCSLYIEGLMHSCV